MRKKFTHVNQFKRKLYVFMPIRTVVDLNNAKTNILIFLYSNLRRIEFAFDDKIPLIQIEIDFMRINEAIGKIELIEYM